MWTRDAREWRHQSGVDAVGDVLEVFGGWREGRQRKVAAARPDATFLWLTLPADRKKHAGYGSGLGVLS